ncbi:MAG: TIGR04283 family arsenosugar biosynthesis glycosyltransferase [Alphaproteobacteria bacterium]|nr:TIGR04283 family arsenosugar biosynthesis glycosyltransferase [Alphaproteobacteria bacterium]
MGGSSLDPGVTVVMPVLHESRRIDAALARLRAAGFDDIVVADGGSTDGTAEKAAAHGVQVVRTRSGRGHQMNVGAAHARGDVLWFVHADVQIPPDARGAIARALRCPTVVAGAFTTRTVADAGPTRLDPVLPVADVRSHYTRLPYGDQALFVRRTAFERVGGFPPQPILEDLELARKLWRIGKIVVVPERVEVSARRFVARPMYYTAVMNLFPVLYRMGVAPDRLARWYGHPR